MKLDESRPSVESLLDELEGSVPSPRYNFTSASVSVLNLTAFRFFFFYKTKLHN